MSTHDRISIGGFVSLGALVVALSGLMLLQIGWLRDDVNSRIDGVEERLNDRIDGVEERLNDRIDDVNDRIDGVETRMSGLEEAMRELGERMARFEGSLSAVVALIGPNETPDTPAGKPPAKPPSRRAPGNSHFGIERCGGPIPAAPGSAGVSPARARSAQHRRCQRDAPRIREGRLAPGKACPPP